MRNPSHVDRIRLENARVRKAIQGIFGLDDQTYCDMQFDFYMAYIDAVFPDDKPELQEEKVKFRSLPGVRAWFIETWNKKDAALLDSIEFDVEDFDDLYCVLAEPENGTPDTTGYVKYTGFTSVDMLFVHYQMIHRFYGVYDIVPSVVQRKKTPVQAPSNT